jgi:predicted Zn-dependent protease
MMQSVQRSITSLLVSAAVAALLGGCASNPATGGVDFVLMSEKAEIELGQTYHQQVMKQFRAYPDPALQDYVNQLGQQLAAASERPELKWTFTLLDDDMVNAFALPGGYVYVTRGMLAYLNSEAELAAVIGHEIGHVTGRHSVRQDTQKKMVGAVSTVAGVATGTPGAMDLTNMFGGVLVSGYGRAMELEADSLGARYMARIGYPPNAMLEVIDILKRREVFEIERARREGREPQVYHGWYATHPDNDTRLNEAIEVAAEEGQGSPDMIRREAYLERINGLLYGTNPGGGVVRGNRLYHAGLRITVTYPESWRIESIPNAIVAYAPGNEAMLQLRSIPLPPDAPEPGTLLSAQYRGLRVEDGRDITVAGKPGHIAVVERAPSPYGPKPVRAAIVYDQPKRRAYMFTGAGRDDLSKIAADRDFIATIFSLDDLQYRDRAKARPVVIRVIEVEEGMTVARLAERSALSGYVEEQIRLLNDLAPDADPQPGELFKSVE